MCPPKPKIPNAIPAPPPPPPAPDVVNAPAEGTMDKLKKMSAGKKRLQIPLGGAPAAGLGIPTV